MEAELVSINEMMPKKLWMRYFIEAQVFTASDKVFYQDNQSRMKLQNNGQGFSGRQTQYINICYLFVTDLIDNYVMRV